MLPDEEYSFSIGDNSSRNKPHITSNVSYRRKKRKFNEMMKYSSNLEIDDLNALKEIYKYYPSKKKKFSGDIDEKTVENYRELELLNELQKDLNDLKISCLSKNIPIQYSTLDENVDFTDIPEITDIPCKKSNNWDFLDYDIDTNSSSFANLENDIPFISHEEKISGKLIDNAIKTEKTFMKFFESMNPNLQPSNSNALVLYQDVEKAKNKIDTNIIVNFLVNEFNESSKKAKEGNTDTEMDLSDFIMNNENMDFEYLVNNTYDDNYNMYLD